MFPFCVERGMRLFCLIFRCFISAVALLAHIFLYVGPFLRLSCPLFLLRSWCDGDC